MRKTFCQNICMVAINASNTLHPISGFVLDETFQQNASKFAICSKTQSSFFRVSFCATLYFSLMNALIYVDTRHSTRKYSRQKKYHFYLTDFFHIEIHFYPPLQTCHDANYHIGCEWKNPPKIRQFFPSQHFHFPFFLIKWKCCDKKKLSIFDG